MLEITVLCRLFRSLETGHVAEWACLTAQTLAMLEAFVSNHCVRVMQKLCRVMGKAKFFFSKNLMAHQGPGIRGDQSGFGGVEECAIRGSFGYEN
jgi:hypothetical protein